MFLAVEAAERLRRPAEQRGCLGCTGRYRYGVDRRGAFFSGLVANIDSPLAHGDKALYEESTGGVIAFVSRLKERLPWPDRVSAPDRNGRNGGQDQCRRKEFLSADGLAEDEHAADDANQRCRQRRQGRD